MAVKKAKKLVKKGVKPDSKAVKSERKASFKALDVLKIKPW